MSPVTRAVMIVGTFMRMISTSRPSSLKKPFFKATPDGRKDILGLVTAMRVWSAPARNPPGIPRTDRVKRMQ